MLACICGGVIEGIIFLIIATFGGGGWAFWKYKGKHGVHGDDDCECDCHHKENNEKT